MLRHNEKGDLEFEVVSIVCGLVGGDTLLPTMAASLSMGVLISQVANNEGWYQLNSEIFGGIVG